jgi:hypothetical protein
VLIVLTPEITDTLKTELKIASKKDENVFILVEFGLEKISESSAMKAH